MRKESGRAGLCKARPPRDKIGTPMRRRESTRARPRLAPMSIRRRRKSQMAGAITPRERGGHPVKPAERSEKRRGAEPKPAKDQSSGPYQDTPSQPSGRTHPPTSETEEKTPTTHARHHTPKDKKDKRTNNKKKQNTQRKTNNAQTETDAPPPPAEQREPVEQQATPDTPTKPPTSISNQC